MIVLRGLKDFQHSKHFYPKARRQKILSNCLREHEKNTEVNPARTNEKNRGIDYIRKNDMQKNEQTMEDVMHEAKTGRGEDRIISLHLLWAVQF